LESLAAIRLSNHSLRIMRSSIEAEGLAWAPLLAEAGIPSQVLDDPNGEVSGAQELRLQEVFAAATRHIPGAWFRTGLRYRLMIYGPLGLAVLAADTFEAGLQVLASFQALTYSLMQYNLVYEDGALVAMTADDRLIGPELREFCQERSLGSATRFLTDMSPTLSPIARIESVLDRPPGWMNCDEVLGASVAFGAPATRWILKPGAGNAPLPMASPLLEETYRSLCARLIQEASVSDDMVSQLYALMVRSGRGLPSAADAGRQLGMSERTLHRRLSGQGLSFGAVLDQVREQRAVYLLDNSRLSIERVADMLGFAETASFSRAFKRWKGLSPLRYRRRSEGSPTLPD
jgi:AraC-like DNA-binding protein